MTTTTSLTTTTTGDGVVGECPLTDTNTQGRRGATIIDNVGGWPECSGACTGSCSYWTWHHDGAGEYAGRCVVMDGFDNLAEDGNTVSGSRECTGEGEEEEEEEETTGGEEKEEEKCIQRNTNTQYR